MNRYAKNTYKVVNELLLSGMNGQFHPGDTIGVWTFNEELHTGQMPLQRWTAETGGNIATNIVNFLRQQPLEKSGQLEKIVPLLSRLVRESEKITVVLVTSGDTKLTGLPYEREISRTFERSNAEMRKQRMPFITVLRGWHGTLIGVSANWAAWTVEFPQFPPEPSRTELVKPGVKSESRPPPQSLIVIGKKPEPVPVTPVPSEQTNSLPATVAVPATGEQSPHKTPITVETPIETVTPRSPSLEPHSIAAPENPPAQTAVVTSPEVKSTRNVFLLVGVTALVVGVGLVVLLMRRFRGDSRPSLITRSMERDK